MTEPPPILTQKIGTYATIIELNATITAVVIVNATDPAAKTTRDFILVARVSKRSASLSVSSAANIVPAMVRKAERSAAASNQRLLSGKDLIVLAQIEQRKRFHTTSGSKELGSEADAYSPDELDLRLMELLAVDGSLTFKDLAKRLSVDKRTVAKHIQNLKKASVLRITADIDWSRIGVKAHAFVGTMTALGDADVARLYEYIKNEPRVIEAYSTLGSDEYFLTVLDTDIQTLREEVLRKLEPLTADLSTAIVSTRLKEKDQATFLSFLLQRRGPRRSKV